MDQPSGRLQSGVLWVGPTRGVFLRGSGFCARSTDAWVAQWLAVPMALIAAFGACELIPYTETWLLPSEPGAFAAFLRNTHSARVLL